MLGRCCTKSFSVPQWYMFFKPQCRLRYDWVLKNIIKDRAFLYHCEKAGLSRSMIEDGFKSFKKDLVYHAYGTRFEAMKVRYVLDRISSSHLAHSSIFPFFYAHAKSRFPVLRNTAKSRKACDLGSPIKWYTEARGLRRSVIFHAGPTNSGKTHAALERFLMSETGIYCCPLRLLAREISQKSQARNVACGLVTGEEENHSKGDTHVACTVEMADLNNSFDVAVIDEIQIIANEERGWAWTQALLGLRAKEIHVCGEPRAISIVERLCKKCDDDFRVLEYERLTKLRVKKYAVGSIDKLRTGDCIVCFSRKDIFDAVSQVKKSGKEPAMIYGKLPPSTKRKEAEKFNDCSNDCKILVATDAVGMGLNLNIKRIVFKSLEKGVKGLDGKISNTQLTTPEVLQIAGRAGRFGLQESGEVTTLYKKDIKLLHRILLNPKEEITHARILPTLKHYVNFSNKMHNSNLFSVLSEFKKFCQIDDEIFQLCSQRDSLRLAQAIQSFDLPLRDAYFFSLCPINCGSEIPMFMFLQFVRHFSQFAPLTFNCIISLLGKFSIKIPLLSEVRPDKIAILEDVHCILGAYLWLSKKYPVRFPDYKRIYELHQTAGNAITMSLYRVRNQPSAWEMKRLKRQAKKLRQKKRPVIRYHKV